MVPAISAHSQTIQLASSIDATAVATKQSSDTASENASVRMYSLRASSAVMLGTKRPNTSSVPRSARIAPRNVNDRTNEKRP